MSLLVCWLVFPLIFGALALGCGLLLERASGITLPGVLLLPVGVAVILVVGSFTTMTDATAELTVPLVIVLAVGGILLSPPWRRRPDRWAVGAAVAVFAVFAAPIVLSGKATFAGYHALDDTAIWLGLSDNALEHGRSLAGLAPSGYESILDAYLDTGYPLGAFVPLGIGSVLTGQDKAWLFQPYLAFIGAMLALGLYSLTTQLIPRPQLRAPIVFIASQPALLYAFQLWGGIKEVVVASLLAMVAGLVAPTLSAEGRWRSFLPLAVGSAAVLAAMSLAAGIWLALLIVLTFGLAVHRRGEVALRQAVAFVGVAVVVAIPAIVTAFKFLGPASNVLTKGLELGKLTRGPLSPFQAFGIWPSGDFRLDPQVAGLAYLLIAVVVAAGVAGLVYAWTQRAWGVLGYIGATVTGSAVVASFASPWTDAKAFTIASPAIVLAALVGAFWVFETGRRQAGELRTQLTVASALIAAAIAGGVLWSNVLAYLHVPLAPRDRLVELDRIGDRIEGQGPTLVTEDNAYAVMHFLRKAAPASTSYFRRPVRLLSDKRRLEFGDSIDPDLVILDDVLFYRTVVRRHSPAGARPPTQYKRIWSGRYYDIWQRGPKPAPIVDHLPIGDYFQPAAKPRCRDVLNLARKARGGHLVAATRPAVIIAPLGRLPHSAGLFPVQGDQTTLVPHRKGWVQFSAQARSPHLTDFWMRGSFQPITKLSLDGKLIGKAREELNYAGEYHYFGRALVSKGTHRLRLDYGGADLHPGSAARGFPIGPIDLTEADSKETLMSVPPEKARSLCGKTLDWVEAVRSG
jgi:hypothetical protein